MSYLLPSEWTNTFVPLQDRCPISSYESIEQLFISDTGSSISSHFDNFEKEPIGAASLAQVHRAIMKGSGQNVAVKVQHPTLEEWVPLDLALTKLTFSILKRFFPEYDLEWLSSEMESSLPQELNFVIEGENALRTKEYFRGLPNISLIIPDVKWSTRRILVMEYIRGHRTDDLDFIDSNNIDRDEVSATLAKIFNEMIFGDCALHCDPHGGNLAIRKRVPGQSPNFEIVLYDHGLYRKISKQTKRDYARLWLAVIDADEDGMRKYASRLAGIKNRDFPLFATAITGRDFRTANASVLSTRSVQEKESISGSIEDGILQQVISFCQLICVIALADSLKACAAVEPGAKDYSSNS